MTIDEGDFEKASLMPNRWYVILRKIDEESFSISAYDTTVEEDGEFYEAGTIVINGIMELLESDFDRIMEAGMARLAFNTVQEKLLTENGDDGPSIKHEEGTNIVKIDFGKVQ
tara:strand:+ start:4580 stop:4918 length:339 start_codon:yes stop_codon:yes gene_type:complete